MRALSAAKWGYLTRRVVGSPQLGPVVQESKLGDLVVAQVSRLGAHDHLENTHGRRCRLYPGDLVIGAYGNRYATDFFEGYLRPDNPAHLLTAGGLIGTVATAHTSKGEPTELTVLGGLADPSGNPLSLEDFQLAPAPPARPELGTMVVVGSSMNAGKTTTAAAIVRGLAIGGTRAGAAKVTGSGSGKDHWAYLDAGACAVTDFIDFGMSSTFGYPVERLCAAMRAMRDTLVRAGAAAVVMEIADGLLQSETGALAARLPGFADRVVLAVGDALGAMAGIEMLAAVGVEVTAVSGLVTASPLASREAGAATGMPVFSPDELAGGAAVDLLGGLTGSDTDVLAGACALG